MSPQRGQVLLEKWRWDWSSNQSLWALSGLWHEAPFKLSVSLSGKGELSGPDHSKAPSNVLGVGQHTVPTFSYILFLLRSVYHRPLKMGPRVQKGKFHLSRTSQLLGNFKAQRRLGVSLPWCQGGQLLPSASKPLSSSCTLGKSFVPLWGVRREDLPYQTMVRIKWDDARTWRWQKWINAL